MQFQGMGGHGGDALVAKSCPTLVTQLTVACQAWRGPNIRMFQAKKTQAVFGRVRTKMML